MQFVFFMADTVIAQPRSGTAKIERLPDFRCLTYQTTITVSTFSYIYNDNMKSHLQIHTQIHSRYQVFDASGHLPFSIVFGLCRRSLADSDSRPLILEIAGSALDVPYALAHDLLTLHEQDPEDAKQWVEVNLSRLNKLATKEAECLTLSSPVNRMEHWRDAFTVYKYHIDVTGELASILEPGKKYIIRLASENLGVKYWAYSDRKQFVDNNGKPRHDSEAVKLVNSKSSAGNATFTVVKSLSWPPRMDTRMRLCASPPSSDPALTNAKLRNSTAIEVTVINTDSDSVTVQTRGHQRFLISWGPFQPEHDADDDRIRIIDATPHKPPTSSLQIIGFVIGEVVRGKEQRGTGPLTDFSADQRPKMEDVATLKPGVPVIQKIDIGALVDELVDGQYRIQMQPRGCRWWHWEFRKEEDEDGVPAHLCGIISPPLMLMSQNEIELRMRDGRVDPSI